MERTSESGLPVDPVYDDSKLTDFRPDSSFGRPGKYPFPCGMYPRMRIDRPPAMRQCAGERVIVAVNRFTADGGQPYRPPRFDPAPQPGRAVRLATLRKQGDDTASYLPSNQRRKAPGTCFTRSATRCAPTSTLGGVCDALRDVWGTSRPEGI